MQKSQNGDFEEYLIKNGACFGVTSKPFSALTFPFLQPLPKTQRFGRNQPFLSPPIRAKNSKGFFLKTTFPTRWC